MFGSCGQADKNDVTKVSHDTLQSQMSDHCFGYGTKRYRQKIEVCAICKPLLLSQLSQCLIFPYTMGKCEFDRGTRDEGIHEMQSHPVYITEIWSSVNRTNTYRLSNDSRREFIRALKSMVI